MLTALAKNTLEEKKENYASAHYTDIFLSFVQLNINACITIRVQTK